MQPVDPRTMVRGPAALTMSFMTRADSQPWQVRWPEVKYSSIVTFLTPLKGSSICVAFVKVSAMVMSSGLFPDAQPMRLGVGLAGLRGRVAHVGRLVDVFQRHLASAEPADEAEQRRPLFRVVHGGADLVGDHPRVEGRPEGVVAVDDADGLGPRERPHEPVGGERAEPPRPDQAHLLALGPHVADADT